MSYTKQTAYVETKPPRTATLKTVRAFILSAAMAFAATSCMNPLSGDIKPSKPATELVDPTTANSLFSDNTVHNIELSITEADWQTFNTLAGQNHKNRFEVPVTMQFNGEVVGRVAMSLSGNTTTEVLQQGTQYFRGPFELDINSDIGTTPGTEDYEAQRNRRIGGQKAIKIQPPSPYDPTQVIEKIAYRMMAEAGVKTHRVGWTKLTFIIGTSTVNFGIHEIVEPINDVLLEQYLGDRKSTDLSITKVRYSFDQGDLTLASLQLRGADGSPALGQKDPLQGIYPIYDTDREDVFLRLVQNLNALSGNDLKTYCDNNIDVDNLLRALAMLSLIGSSDNLIDNGNNYDIVYDRITKKYYILPYDHDNAFSVLWKPNNTARQSIYDWFKIPNAQGQTTDRPILKLLEIPQYKTTYTNYIKEFGRTIVTYTKFQEYYTTYTGLIGSHLLDDTQNGPRSTSLPGYVSDYFATRQSTIASELGLPADYFNGGGSALLPTLPLIIRTDGNSWGDTYAMYETSPGSNIFKGNITNPQTTGFKIDDASPWGDFILGGNNAGEIFPKGNMISLNNINYPAELTVNLNNSTWSIQQLYTSRCNNVAFASDALNWSPVRGQLIDNNLWRLVIRPWEYTSKYKLILDGVWYGDTNYDGTLDSGSSAWNLWSDTNTYSLIHYLNDSTNTYVRYKALFPEVGIRTDKNWERTISGKYVNDFEIEITLNAADFDHNFKFAVYDYLPVTDNETPTQWWGSNSWGSTGSSQTSNIYWGTNQNLKVRVNTQTGTFSVTPF